MVEHFSKRKTFQSFDTIYRTMLPQAAAKGV